jgi:hypothetical protein
VLVGVDVVGRQIGATAGAAPMERAHGAQEEVVDLGLAPAAELAEDAPEDALG